MSHPAERSMPVVEARWSDLSRRWYVDLPGGIKYPARSEAEVEDAVRRFASGASIRFTRPPGK